MAKNVETLPSLPPLERGLRGPLPKKMNFYIAAREILRITDNINLSLIHWFHRQTFLKLPSPHLLLKRGARGFSPEKFEFLHCST